MEILLGFLLFVCTRRGHSFAMFDKPSYLSSYCFSIVLNDPGIIVVVVVVETGYSLHT